MADEVKLPPIPEYRPDWDGDKAEFELTYRRMQLAAALEREQALEAKLRVTERALEMAHNAGYNPSDAIKYARAELQKESAHNLLPSSSQPIKLTPLATDDTAYVERIARSELQKEGK